MSYNPLNKIITRIDEKQIDEVYEKVHPYSKMLTNKYTHRVFFFNHNFPNNILQLGQEPPKDTKING